MQPGPQLLRIHLVISAVIAFVGCRSAQPTEPARVSEVAPPRASASAVAPAASVAAPPRLSLGDSHACFVGTNGKVYCWGANRNNQLGDGSDDNRSVPTPVVGLENAVTVAAGAQQTCAIDKDGRVYCWGGIRNPERPRPVRIAMPPARWVSVGDYHSCAALNDGGVRCWGNNGDGQLGDGSSSSKDDDTAVEPRGLRGVSEVATGHSVSCALTASGEVWCWGRNGERQSLVPARVEGLPPITALRMSWEQACGLAKDSTVYCWSKWRAGEVDEQPAPTRVEGWSGVRDFAVGSFDACALLESGDVRCSGSTAKESAFGGYLVGKPKQIAKGGGTTCVLADDDSVRCAGRNEAGQLGIGEQNDWLTPQDIPGSADAVDVVPSAVGGCLLSRAGRVSCWGLGDYPRGDEARAVDAVPLELENVKRILPGFTPYEVCAGLKNGELWCFTAGQPRAVGKAGAPHLIKGVKNALAIRALSLYIERAAYVLTESGELSLARPQKPETNAGKTTATLETNSFRSLGKIAQLANDDEHTCVLLRDGKVLCWPQDLRKKITDFNPKTTAFPALGPSTMVGKGKLWCARSREATFSCWAFEGGSIEPKVGPEAQATLTGASVTQLDDDGLVFTLPDGSVVQDADKFGGASWGGAKLPLYPTTLGAFTAIRKRGNGCLVRSTGKVACWGRNFGDGLGRYDRHETKEALLVKLPPEAAAPPKR